MDFDECVPRLSRRFPSGLPAKPVPDICYRGAGIQGNGRELGARGEQGWAWGDFGGGEKTLDSRLQPAGMTEGRPAGRTGRSGLGVGAARVVHSCNSREACPRHLLSGSGNPGEWAGSRGRGAKVGCVATSGRRKDTGFPLTTCGNDRRGLAGMTEGGRRE